MKISDCQGGYIHGYLYPNPNITEVFWETIIFRHIYTYSTDLNIYLCLPYLNDVPGSIVITIDSFSLINSLNQFLNFQNEKNSPYVLLVLIWFMHIFQVWLVASSYEMVHMKSNPIPMDAQWSGGTCQNIQQDLQYGL